MGGDVRNDLKLKTMMGNLNKVTADAFKAGYPVEGVTLTEFSQKESRGSKILSPAKQEHN